MSLFVIWMSSYENDRGRQNGVHTITATPHLFVMGWLVFKTIVKKGFF